MTNKIALAIHGGAGTILREKMTREMEIDYRAGLKTSLQIGWQIISGGGSALDAVEASVIVLENDPLFNAGRGSVFTNGGKNEMDASIMCGQTLEAGAVAFVRNIKNPIKLARFIMEKTEHVLLAGAGAGEFAREIGAEFAPDEYFHTDLRYGQLLKARETGTIQLDHSGGEGETRRRGDKETGRQGEEETDRQSEIGNPKSKIDTIGTVGAVACDRRGNLAAATSTGGMTNKKFGRVGDTSIIGAGTYADNNCCAVSCTGHGEFFMKAVTAYDVAARMKYKSLDLKTAAAETITHLANIGGEGGLIAVDSHGNLTLPFNCAGMYRGHINTDGKIVIEIYKSDTL